ncbi:hypothetical protein KA005_57945 [bacterium]|nr:hypothetical protein [bacterium]
MKKSIIFFCMFLYFSFFIHADVYVKGILHVDGGYRWGHNVPELNVINEWWFGKNKVTFISTGWRLEFLNTDRRLTLDKEKQHILVVDLKEKSYVVVPLPMNLSSHVDPPLTKQLNRYKIYGAVKTTGEKKTIHQKECEGYTVVEWILQGDVRFYERERAIMATTQVPFDWKLINELYEWIRSFINPQNTYISELKKMKGFVLAEDVIVFESAGKVTWSFKVLEISEKKAPLLIYDLPKEYKKKDKLNGQDLWDIRGIVYPWPLY